MVAVAFVVAYIPYVVEYISAVWYVVRTDYDVLVLLYYCCTINVVRSLPDPCHTHMITGTAYYAAL